MAKPPTHSTSAKSIPLIQDLSSVVFRMASGYHSWASGRSARLPPCSLSRWFDIVKDVDIFIDEDGINHEAVGNWWTFSPKEGGDGFFPLPRSKCQPKKQASL